MKNRIHKLYLKNQQLRRQLTLIRSTDCSCSVGLTVSVRIKKSAGLKFPGHGNPMLLEEKEWKCIDFFKAVIKEDQRRAEQRGGVPPFFSNILWVKQRL